VRRVLRQERPPKYRRAERPNPQLALLGRHTIDLHRGCAEGEQRCQALVERPNKLDQDLSKPRRYANESFRVS